MSQGELTSWARRILAGTAADKVDEIVAHLSTYGATDIMVLEGNDAADYLGYPSGSVLYLISSEEGPYEWPITGEWNDWDEDRDYDYVEAVNHYQVAIYPAR